jgi:PAS domain S-box-containing protein
MAAVVAVIAVAVLAGWAIGQPILTSGLPGLVQTKFNAAVCFLLLALALGLDVRRPAHYMVVVTVLAGAVTAIAAATIFQHFSGISLGIDQFLVQDKVSAASPYPGRFAVQTGVAFIAAALAALSVGRSFRGVFLTEAFGLVCGAIGLVSLLGYLYGASQLLSIGSASQVSLPASIAIVALGLGLVSSNPDHPLVRQTTDPGPAGRVMRRIVPAAFVIVPFGAWLRIMGERAGLYDESIGLSILVSFEALLLVAVGAWTTASVRHLIVQRQQVELDLVRLGAAVSTPLIETAPIGLAVLDMDLRYLYVNPALATMDGLAPLVHLGQRIDRVSPDFGREAVGILESVLKTGGAVRDLEVAVNGLGDGKPGTWLLSAEPLRDETSAPMGLAISVVEITERKHREEALAALVELRRQTEVIGESLPYGIWIAEPDGGMRYLSASFLDLIGQTAEQARGLGWTEALAPEDATATVRDWHSAIAARQPWNRELCIDGVDGRRHTVISRGFPVWDGRGKVVSWAGINLDITDRKEAEAFREAFTGILSHELRTPITAIHAASTLLSRADLEQSQRAELVEDIYQEAERLRRLVEDLVVLAKAERGTIQVHTEPVPLPHVLRKVCDQEQARRPDQTIDFVVEGSVPVARAETALVEQVVRNLIGNAAKYGPRDQPIELIADAADGLPRVRVLDRGPGVDPAEAGRLFELFYRSQRTAHIAGSGIGLFVAHRLIESMGGEIWARPRADGKGAEFGFTLQPVRDDV